MITANNATAIPLSGIDASVNSENTNIIKIHGVHNSCLYDVLTPSITGNQKSWHKTPEAGIHIQCTPPRKPGAGKLKLNNGNNANKYKLKKFQYKSR